VWPLENVEDTVMIGVLLGDQCVACARTFAAGEKVVPVEGELGGDPASPMIDLQRSLRKAALAEVALAKEVLVQSVEDVLAAVARPVRRLAGGGCDRTMSITSPLPELRGRHPWR
jgi:hypothetical protein